MYTYILVRVCVYFYTYTYIHIYIQVRVCVHTHAQTYTETKPARRVGCGLAASLSIAGGFNNASIATLAASAVFRRYAPRAFQGAAGGKLHKASVAKHAPREPPPVLIARACLTCHNFPAMLTVTTTAMCGHGALRVGTLHGFGRRQPVTARVDDAAAPPVTPPSMPMCS